MHCASPRTAKPSTNNEAAFGWTTAGEGPRADKQTSKEVIWRQSSRQFSQTHLQNALLVKAIHIPHTSTHAVEITQNHTAVSDTPPIYAGPCISPLQQSSPKHQSLDISRQKQVLSQCVLQTRLPLSTGSSQQIAGCWQTQGA